MSCDYVQAIIVAEKNIAENNLNLIQKDGEKRGVQ